MAFDLNYCYCTQEEVQAHARMTYTSSTIPTVTQVEQFAREICREIELKTQGTGSTVSFAPPKSTWSSAYPAIAVVLTAANAIGAAWRAVRATPGADDIRELEAELKEDYLRYIGNTDTGGNITGLIVQALTESGIAGVGDARFISSDVISGEVTLDPEDSTSRVVTIPFHMDDPE